MYTAVVRRDSNRRGEVEGDILHPPAEELVSLIRRAGADTYEGGEFNNSDSGIFIEKDDELVLSFQKRESHWRVVINFTGVSSGELLDALVHPHG